MGEPPADQAFFVGVSLAEDRYSGLMGQDLVAWRTEIRGSPDLGGAGFRVFRFNKRLRPWRPLFLVELATRCVTLDEQVQYLGDWIDESLTYIVQHPPAIFD